MGKLVLSVILLSWTLDAILRLPLHKVPQASLSLFLSSAESYFLSF